MMCPACLVQIDLDPTRWCLHAAPAAATLWLPDEWPTLAQVLAGGTDVAVATRHRWYELAQKEATAAAVPRMAGRVFFLFRHFRRRYSAGRDRSLYGTFVESVVLQIFERAGVFQHERLDGIAHVFLELERGEHRLPIASPGVQVVVLERS